MVGPLFLLFTNHVSDEEESRINNRRFFKIISISFSYLLPRLRRAFILTANWLCNKRCKYQIVWKCPFGKSVFGKMALVKRIFGSNDLMGKYPVGKLTSAY